jgi:hypothetical protein
MGKSGRTVADALTHPADAVREVMAPAANLDKPMAPGEWTPRQRYQAAQDAGVQLDKSDATGGRGIFGAIKRVNRNSWLGHGAYDQAGAENVAGLNSSAEALINSAAPESMSQTEFGDAVRGALAQHKQQTLDSANTIYKDLATNNGDTAVPMDSIRDQAQKLVDSKKDLIDNAGKSATGGVKSAFGIASELAKGGEGKASFFVDSKGNPLLFNTKGPDTLNYPVLSDIRSNLLSKVRDGEIKDGPGAGMVKQLISTIDEAMVNSLSPADQVKFRDANDIFKGVKETHDNPSHPFHSIGQDQTGMGAAQKVSNLRPEQIANLRSALNDVGRDDLNGQAQRQQLERILRPNTEDLKTKTLTKRMQGINQEKLAGVLQPEQIEGLRNLGKLADVVNYDFNPSGTGKLNQQNAEAKKLIGGLGILAEGLAGGHYGAVSPEAILPVLGAAGVAAAQHPVARFINSAPSTDWMMRPGFQFLNRSIWPSIVKAIAAGGASTGGAEPSR